MCIAHAHNARQQGNGHLIWYLTPVLTHPRSYSKEWEVTVKRLGRWIDFENDYKTLDPSFMESVW